MGRKLLQNAEALIAEKQLCGLVVAFILWTVEGAPERKLRLHVNAEKVGRDKSCLGRTAGVETVVVNAKILRGFHNGKPSLHTHRGKSGKRKDHSVVLAAEKCATAVDAEMITVCHEGS